MGPIPGEWLDASFSYGNTTPKQQATVADIQSELGMPPWVCDGLPGLDTWGACQTHPVGVRLAARVTSVLTGVCAHDAAVPVETLGTVLDPPEVVAFLCPGCDAQLPATWKLS
ncbi:hypothetical protein ACWFMI_25050 [Nocardiopsis terrae]